MSRTLKTWNAAMYVLLVLLGLWVQFRYADRWDYGDTAPPGKAPPGEEMPSIYPGADVESHTGYGYVERPAAGTEKVEAPAEAPGSPS